MLSEIKQVRLPKIEDERGNLTFIEADNHIPFKVMRVYWIYDVPGGEIRGGHAYKKNKEFIVALSGSFDVIVKDGNSKRKFSLNRSYYGLYLPDMLWRHIENFSTNALCLILASKRYSEKDYIRKWEDYKRLVK